MLVKYQFANFLFLFGGAKVTQYNEKEYHKNV